MNILYQLWKNAWDVVIQIFKPLGSKALFHTVTNYVKIIIITLFDINKTAVLIVTFSSYFYIYLGIEKSHWVHNITIHNYHDCCKGPQIQRS